MKMGESDVKEEMLLDQSELQLGQTMDDNTIYIGVDPQAVENGLDFVKLFGCKAYFDVTPKTETFEEEFESNLNHIPVQLKVDPECENGDNNGKIKDEKDGFKRLNCDLCEYATDYTSHMKKHKQRKHGDVELKIVADLDAVAIGDIMINRFICEDGLTLYGCDICEYKSPEKSAVKRHKLRMHTMNQSNNLTQVDPINVNNIQIQVFKSNDGTLVYGCDLCGYKATEKSTIARHKERKHYGKPYDLKKVDGGFLCDKCDFKTNVLRNLKMHIKRIHEPKPTEFGVSLVCDQCSYQGQNPRQLQRHIKEKHSTFICSQCPYPAPGPLILDAHVNYVHNGIYINCDVCQFEASDKTILLYHVKTTHEKDSSEVSAGISKDEFGNLVYSCHICQFHSTKPSHVTEHIQLEHFGIKTEKFLRRQMHTARTNQIESKCEYCDYVGKKRNVTKHMKGKHLGVKHTCEKCGWQCSDPSNLKKHIKSKHLIL
eukprot:TRINITY_DN74938_c0_g1_i1.p1 TRINITY_DN74938_c0_g1~~TRINITY_DN74938_c0_g1_i1.p1  ORF type:complete len:485 (-),score=88.90 TRINITY_DN74938_c0_g1_i1:65-1519(-)